MVGIAVSSLLIVGLFQLLTDLSKFQRQYADSALTNHRRAALVRILSQDLSGLPRDKPEMEGQATEFYRTTVAVHPTKGHRMQTRVRYFIRRNDDRAQLYRASRWVDLQDDFSEPRLLYESPSMSFRYRIDDRTVRSPSPDEDTIRAVVLRLPRSDLMLPVRQKSKESNTDDVPRKGSP
jgi:hypothetical protein